MNEEYHYKNILTHFLAAQQNPELHKILLRLPGETKGSISRFCDNELAGTPGIISLRGMFQHNGVLIGVVVQYQDNNQHLRSKEFLFTMAEVVRLRLKGDRVGKLYGFTETLGQPELQSLYTLLQDEDREPFITDIKFEVDDLQRTQMIIAYKTDLGENQKIVLLPKTNTNHTY